MAQVNKNTLKEYFETGSIPNQSNFEDLIDSVVNIQDDSSAVKTMYESNSNTNNFTDVEKSSLSDLNSGATLANDDTKFATQKQAKDAINELDSDLQNQINAFSNGEGKTYTSLSDAMAVSPTPSNNTPFQVDGDSAPVNDGKYIYDSGESGGYLRLGDLIKTSDTFDADSDVYVPKMNQVGDYVDTLESGFKSIATPSTDPSEPNFKIGYIAYQAGTYTNFNNYLHDGKEVVWFKWTGSGNSWLAIKLGTPTVYENFKNRGLLTVTSTNRFIAEQFINIRVFVDDIDEDYDLRRVAYDDETYELRFDIYNSANTQVGYFVRTFSEDQTGIKTYHFNPETGYPSCALEVTIDFDLLQTFSFNASLQVAKIPKKTSKYYFTEELNEIAIQILKSWLNSYDNRLIPKGVAYVGDNTPTATDKHTYLAVENGTIFGQSVTAGQLLVGNGSTFIIENVEQIDWNARGIVSVDTSFEAWTRQIVDITAYVEDMTETYDLRKLTYTSATKTLDIRIYDSNVNLVGYFIRVLDSDPSGIQTYYLAPDHINAYSGVALKITIDWDKYIALNANASLIIRTEPKDTALYRKIFDIEDLVYIGDSLTIYGTDGLPYPTYIRNQIDEKYRMINLGIGGETSRTIGGRQGGLPYVIDSDFTIPSTTTPVSFTFESLDGGLVQPLLQGSSGLNPVLIDGIEGVISESSGTYYFTRSEAGDEREIYTDTIIETLAMRENRSGIHIILVGQNGGWDDDVNKYLDQIDKMTSFLNHNKFVVITPHGNTTTSLESAMLQKYGARYINMRQYLSTNAIYDAGITPTAEDLTAMTAGNCPPSLLYDVVHLNASGNQVWADYVLNKLVALGYVVI